MSSRRNFLQASTVAGAGLLHELHSASLGGDGQPPAPMVLALASSFGSAERWRDEFVAMGKTLSGDSGWVTLSYLPDEGTLVNRSADERTQCVVGGVPILALHVSEHAYQVDFGTDVAAYVDHFMESVNWAGVSLRYAQAVHAASEGLGAPPQAAGSAMVIDVRRHGVFADAETVIPNSQWRDPAHIAQWIEQLPRDREILLYCVYGHEVGRGSAVRLRANGFNARYLEGGIDAWKQAGLPLQAKGEES